MKSLAARDETIANGRRHSRDCLRLSTHGYRLSRYFPHLSNEGALALALLAEAKDEMKGQAASAFRASLC